MRTYKMTIQYDGTRYRGWQKQPDTELTIQTQMEKAVSAELGYTVEVLGSGRTDGGVHAKGQVAHMKIAGKIVDPLFKQKVNERLPEDIRLQAVELTKNGFHSRYKAKTKKYCYRIDQREKGNVFRRRYCWNIPEKLDIAAMKRAASFLIGEHDFAAFTDQKEDKSTTKTIYKIEFLSEGDLLTISYYGSGFLYHMVRILTGTLVEVGLGEREAESIRQVLNAGERSQAGSLAPAKGLTMDRVIYGGNENGN